MQYRQAAWAIFEHFFYKIRCREGVPGHGELHGRGSKNVDLQVPKSPKLVIFGINFPQSGISP